MIGDLLDLSRIEAGHLTIAPQRHSVAVLINDMLELWRPMAQEKSITLVAALPEESFVVAAAIAIACCSCSRASPATRSSSRPRAARIEIAISSADSHALFRVRDSGSGICAPRRAAAHLRPLLARREARSRHRARALHRQGHRRGARRAHRGPERGRRRDHGVLHACRWRASCRRPSPRRSPPARPCSSSTTTRIWCSRSRSNT